MDTQLDIFSIMHPTFKITKPIRLIELFGGIGAPRKALERLNIDFKVVDYVEIDKYAVKSYNAIYNENFEPQDICEWDKDIEVDLIFHGSPCQDFSLAGKQAGGEEESGTRSSLMWHTVRIVEKLKPKYVIWENVKNVISKKHRHTFDKYLSKLEELGYTNHWQVLNAKDYGIPQNRERVFVISILGEHKPYTFPPKQELKLSLKDMLEDEVDEKYYLSNKMIKYISATGTANFRNPDCKINLDIARPLTTAPNKRAGTTNYFSDDLPDNYDLNGSSYLRNFGSKGKLQDKGVVMSDLRIRKPTPKEYWRLMGFADEDFEKAAQVNSNTQLYKQAGNSIVVNVLEAIFKELFRVGE
ncbi:MAG TPA: DNA cytosine methyltransferase [Gallicola sp.]|nr:DNA cytosine methyltransferase [Gallicola sp.]